MHRPRYLGDEAWTEAWGIGWYAVRRESGIWVQHSGGLHGFTSNVCFDPKQKVGAIVLVNGDSSPAGICMDLADIGRRASDGGSAADRAAGAAAARVGRSARPLRRPRVRAARPRRVARRQAQPAGRRRGRVAADPGADGDGRPVRGQPGRPRVRRGVRLSPPARRPSRVDDARHNLAAPARPGRPGLTGPLSRRRSAGRRRRSRPAPTPAPRARGDRTSCLRRFAALPADRRRPGGRAATRRTRRPG